MGQRAILNQTKRHFGNEFNKNAELFGSKNNVCQQINYKEEYSLAESVASNLATIAKKTKPLLFVPKPPTATLPKIPTRRSSTTDDDVIYLTNFVSINRNPFKF